MNRNRDNEVFEHALLRPAAERRPLVEASCGDEPDVGDEVLSLPSAYEHVGDFLASPTSAGSSAPVDTLAAAGRDAADHLGTRIGQYILLERIGEGGFGTVYMAEQREPRGGICG
ncbi:MAG: hypothetical protein IT450_09630 [Phycisphaerales bacterium]|nr:hypothetical protein [Phycisphaerales bacterium]